MIYLRRTISIFLIACALLIGTTLGGSLTQAIAEPVTPEAAAYEIDHADSPQAAGQRIQDKAQDYKKELKEDSQYTKQAAKGAVEDSQNAFQRAAETVKDKAKSG